MMLKIGLSTFVSEILCSLSAVWWLIYLNPADAVNCQGIWGMGIAYELKKRLPAAFRAYKEKCDRAGTGVIGQCLIIPPQSSDYELKDGLRVVYSPRSWVACLFTSTGYGRKNKAKSNPGKDRPEQILQYTKAALADMRMQLEGFGATNFDKNESWKTDDEKPGQILAVKFNSGAFGVKWELTEALILETFTGFERPWFIFDRQIPPEPDAHVPKPRSPWVVPSFDD